MPRCYLLAVTSGSALDQHSNNVTLFNMVEQINVPQGAPPPPGGILPLEIHAYYELSATEINERFEVRYAMVSDSGLETYTDVFSYKSTTIRFRTRTLGLPVPPVTGLYHVRVDTRTEGTGDWKRDALMWPIAIVETTTRPQITH